MFYLKNNLPVIILISLSLIQFHSSYTTHYSLIDAKVEYLLLNLRFHKKLNERYALKISSPY